MENRMIKAIEAQKTILDVNMFDNLIKVLNALVRGEQLLNLISVADTWVFFPSIYAIIGKEILHTDTDKIEVSYVALRELDLVLKELDLFEGSMSSNIVKPEPVTYKALAGLGELPNK